MSDDHFITFSSLRCAAMTEYFGMMSYTTRSVGNDGGCLIARRLVYIDTALRSRLSLHRLNLLVVYLKTTIPCQLLEHFIEENFMMSDHGECPHPPGSRGELRWLRERSRRLHIQRQPVVPPEDVSPHQPTVQPEEIPSNRVDPPPLRDGMLTWIRSLPLLQTLLAIVVLVCAGLGGTSTWSKNARANLERPMLLFSRPEDVRLSETLSPFQNDLAKAAALIREWGTSDEMGKLLNPHVREKLAAASVDLRSVLEDGHGTVVSIHRTLRGQAEDLLDVRRRARAIRDSERPCLLCWDPCFSCWLEIFPGYTGRGRRTAEADWILRARDDMANTMSNSTREMARRIHGLKADVEDVSSDLEHIYDATSKTMRFPRLKGNLLHWLERSGLQRNFSHDEESFFTRLWRMAIVGLFPNLGFPRGPEVFFGGVGLTEVLRNPASWFGLEGMLGDAIAAGATNGHVRAAVEVLGSISRSLSAWEARKAEYGPHVENLIKALEGVVGSEIRDAADVVEHVAADLGKYLEEDADRLVNLLGPHFGVDPAPDPRFSWIPLRG
ncbi:hypothetical protein F4805DRAFT_262896 [Annulohypoxylon moriforme]|nr:hypothetical protein F4805DRAFT_262896 [Annulohypoxylon moriforme]